MDSLAFRAALAFQGDIAAAQAAADAAIEAAADLGGIQGRAALCARPPPPWPRAMLRRRRTRRGGLAVFGRVPANAATGRISVRWPH